MKQGEAVRVSQAHLASILAEQVCISHTPGSPKFPASLFLPLRMSLRRLVAHGHALWVIITLREQT